MSEVALVHLITALDLFLIAGILLVLPRVARRGLLFGAHVGVDVDATERAAGLRRLWVRGIAACFAACLALALGLGLSGRPLAGCFVPLTCFLAGATVLYLRLHRAARDLTPARPGEPLPAPPGSSEPSSLALPLLTLVTCLLIATGGVLDAARHWGDLPERVPTHFGASGRPDAWSARSFGSVFALPLTNLVMGLMMGGFAVLTARARLSLRRSRSPRERQAQLDFRRATVNLLCGAALLCSALFGLISWESLRVGLGERESLGHGTWVLTGALLVFALGYTVRLVWVHGQGGSRREGEAASDPLTDGLADDRHWKWGLLYVNPEDPAILVEKRFGVGYTVNLGNRWGLGLLAALLGLFAAVVVLAVASA